jgi:hypothetical protein
LNFVFIYSFSYCLWFLPLSHLFRKIAGD